MENGLIARAELEKSDTAVNVREREIAETEASIRVIQRHRTARLT